MADADRPTRPPLTRTLQKFLCGIQLPPAPKKGPNPNKDYALLLNALAWHAAGVTENTDSVTCSPSMRQVAQIMHCSTRTVQRIIHELQSLGFIRIRRRGNHLANIFTVYQTAQRSDATTVVHSKTETRHDNSKCRHDNSAVQTRQLTVQTRQQLSSSGVDLQDSKELSGVVLQGKAESKAKAALSFRGEGQKQTQPRKRNGRDDTMLFVYAGELRDAFPESGSGAWPYLQALQAAIKHRSELDNLDYWEAKGKLEQEMRQDQSAGTSINAEYFLAKVPIEKMLAQPKRRRSLAEQEYASQLAESESRDEYEQEEEL